MRRIVLDTNVWLAALLYPRGVCDELLQQVQQRRIELCVSKAIVEEIREVLCRKFDFTAQEAETVVDEIRLMAKVIEPRVRVSIVQTDEADNRVLECALEAHADLIVTGDTKHLLSLNQVHGIPIRSPRAVLDRFRA